MPAPPPSSAASPQLVVRRAESRGGADHGWLKTRHTFSFADYFDPRWMQFRALRVINDDRIAPGAGFPPHPHRNMEIVTYVLEGAIAHEDSMGNGSTIRPGDLQRMSAGAGIRHSEFNPLPSTWTRMLQIWLTPEEGGGLPSYAQATFGDERHGRLRLMASRNGREGSLSLARDVDLYAGVLGSRDRVAHPLAPGRHAWLHVAEGEITAVVRTGDTKERLELRDGDGLGLSGVDALELEQPAAANVLLFDLD